MYLLNNSTYSSIGRNFLLELLSYIISLPEEVSPSATTSLEDTRKPHPSSFSSHAPSTIHGSPVGSVHVLLVPLDGRGRHKFLPRTSVTL